MNFIRGAQLADGSFDAGSLSNYVTSSVVMTHYKISLHFSDGPGITLFINISGVILKGLAQFYRIRKTQSRLLHTVFQEMPLQLCHAQL